MSKQNPSVAKKAIGKFTDSDDPKMIEGTYEQFAPYWDANLAVQSEPIQGQLIDPDEKEFPRAKDARPADFIDNSFAENTKSSGFLQFWVYKVGELSLELRHRIDLMRDRAAMLLRSPAAGFQLCVHFFHERKLLHVRRGQFLPG